jgi:hypothetical protein
MLPASICIHTYMHTYIHAYIIHTCIHTYIHTYIHIRSGYNTINTNAACIHLLQVCVNVYTAPQRLSWDCCWYVCMWFMYVCMYLSTYIWLCRGLSTTAAGMYVCVCICMYVCMYVGMYVCRYVFMHECVNRWMVGYMNVKCVCIYRYVYMYVCVCAYTCMYEWFCT